MFVFNAQKPFLGYMPPDVFKTASWIRQLRICHCRLSSFGGTGRCMRRTYNEEAYRHLTPHPTALPVPLGEALKHHGSPQDLRVDEVAAGYCRSSELPGTEGLTVVIFTGGESS